MYKKIKYIPGSVIFILFLFSSCSCRENYTPKPPGYIKVEYPEKKYKMYDAYPAFRFEYPEYASITPDSSFRAQEGWLNIDLPSLNGTIFLSYKKINHNLESYVEDSRSMVYKHTIKAESIDEIPIKDPNRKIFGILYDLKGNVASSVQFFVTDSVNHFIRGSLYFNAQPNQDSLAPLVSFVRKDIDHMIKTLEWK
jgi:gliding motility-associated lipoprotein GldD